MIIHFRPFDLDPSSTTQVHPQFRSSKAPKPITCIFSFDLTLHKIFITCKPSLLIFSFLYTQILCQYLGPISQTKYLGPKTSDQNLESIPRTNTSDQKPQIKTLDQYLGPIPRTKTLIFHPIHTFPSEKVLAYIYAPSVP